MTSRIATSVGAIALATLGAVIGIAIYDGIRPTATTTTVVEQVATPETGQPIAATAGLTVTEIYRRAHKGVVDIRARQTSSSSQDGGGSRSGTAEGSGFVFDAQGHIVTNQHVIGDSTSIKVEFWNGAVYDARVIESDSSTDLAVIKVSAPSSLLHPLTLANSNTVQVGDGVIAIGSPFGLAGSVTSGIVSALHRSMTSPNHFTIGDSIQTDAPINHGNSGGPLLNSSGQVIGVTTQIQTESGGNDGVGFAVPSNTIHRIAPKLVAGEKVHHAYLGIYVEDAKTSSSATAGALASQVKPGTPAALAGLRRGDVIVRLDGAKVTSSDDLTRILDLKQPGSKLAATYLRGGTSHTVTITLGTRPS
jgi:putative serine protease PepD